jgi:murein L,D-transpeptidase YafK
MKLIVIFLSLFSFNLFAYEVDEVQVYKTQHIMKMLYKDEVTKIYSVMLGRGGMSPKRKKGDKLVPEGEYILDYKNPYSKFYRSIHLTYPNADDIRRAASLGVNPGFDIFIHGMPNYFTELSKILDFKSMKLLFSMRDWTAGCVAVTNQEMSEIWDNVQVPTKITIFH